MGAHSVYIWISYGGVLGCLAWFLWSSLKNNLKIKQRLKQNQEVL